ncbi:hypothetical protein NLJ89_g7432 [Agrocybe chaxingu]|uniref:Hydrophobin n=1 Tax=Agrocybe chaxingu TaxID=84603 RepID=A0A9W8JXD6_9AGAR|nr:hypothetical protein NLJ89_g7432 [Agrocybe chaxingu]
MQFKLLASALALAATFVAATSIPTSECMDKSLCCNRTGTAEDSFIAKALEILSAFGILSILGTLDTNALMAAECSPITGGDTSCTAGRAVCCSRTTNVPGFGLFALDCQPASI